MNAATQTLTVGLGGALGSILRYWVGHWFKAQPWAKDFFWGTLTINVTGSILLGLFAACFRDRVSTPYLLLGTGLCGGYTTFSTFSLEAVELMQRGRWEWAALYVGASVAGGVVGFALAFEAVKS